MVQLTTSLGIAAAGDGVPGEVRRCTIAHQAMTNWCWAAVTAGVVNSGNGGPTDQDRVARRFQGHRYPENTVEFLDQVLRGEGAMRDPVEPINPAADNFGTLIRPEIDADRPLCAQISSLVRQHYVAVTGYAIGPGGAVTLLVQDPADPDPAGAPRRVPLTQFLTSYEGGFWVRAFRTDP